jgi:hypothetical protein
MAVYRPLTEVRFSKEMRIASGATIDGEGFALVTTLSGGVQGVAKSGGSSGEIFAGFSFTQTSAANFLVNTEVKVEQFVIPAGGAITLSRTPTSSTTSVYDITDGGAISGGNLAVSGNVATITAASTRGATGNTVRVTYRYALTVAEFKLKYGDVTPGGYAGHQLGTVGVAQNGKIFTNCFDTTIDWSAVTTIRTGAGGLLTNTGSGATVNGYVTDVPSVDYPFLGLQFAAAGA